MDLKELGIIHNMSDDLFDIVRFCRVIWYDGIESLIHAQGIIAIGEEWWVFHIILGQERE